MRCYVIEGTCVQQLASRPMCDILGSDKTQLVFNSSSFTDKFDDSTDAQ